MCVEIFSLLKDVYLRTAVVSVFFFTSLAIFAQTPSKTKEKETPPTKIGYVSVDYLLQQQPEFKDIQTTISTKQQQVVGELKRLNEEFQAKAEAYRKDNSQLNDIIRLDREKELQHLQNRMQDFDQTAQKQVKEQSNQLLSPLLKKVQTAVNAYAKENNYRYVFNSDANSPWPTLLYAPEEDGLNEALLKKMGITPPAKDTNSKETAATTPEKQPDSTKDKP